jgi:putative transposase
MQELCARYPVYGHPKIYHLIRREWPEPINHKRTERIYRQEKMSLRRKRGRKRLRHLRLALPQVEGRDDVWSMDFIFDRLSNGRQLKILTIIDHATRELPDLVHGHSIKSADVVAALEKLRLLGRKPKIIVTDNGSEFRANAMQAWATKNDVRLHFIEPRKPTQNAFIESLNGKFREGCLDRNLFENLDSAGLFIRMWKREYETERPHDSLGGLTPAEFAAKIGAA